jgi:uncharacterized protein YqgC (DUF456 family)
VRRVQLIALGCLLGGFAIEFATDSPLITVLLFTTLMLAALGLSDILPARRRGGGRR